MSHLFDDYYRFYSKYAIDFRVDSAVELTQRSDFRPDPVRSQEEVVWTRSEVMALIGERVRKYASDLLQRYLIEQYGFFTWYMSGRYGYGWDAESHAWLETEDRLVIDITGDQYDFKKMKFTEPVYIGSRTDGFHDKFELDESVEYSGVWVPAIRDRIPANRAMIPMRFQ